MQKRLRQEPSELRNRRNMAQKSIVMIGPICPLAFASDTASGQCSDPELRTNFFVPAEGTSISTIDRSYFSSTELRRESPFAPKVNRAFTIIFLALTGLGVTHTFLNYLPGGVHLPHTHPRGTEVRYVLQGTLSVDLIDTATKSCSQTFQAGDLFVLLKYLVHCQNNDHPDKAEVKALSAFSSVNPGVKNSFASVFGSGFNFRILATAFDVTRDTITALEAAFATT